MRIAELFLFSCTLGAISGCNSDAGSESSDMSAEFSVGAIRSTDQTYLPLDVLFNSWLITTIGDSQEIMLKAKEELGEFNDPAIWAMAIRKDEAQLGMVFADQAEITIFQNYVPRDDICCINNRPFRDFDSADISFRAVSGYVSFLDGSKRAVFDLDIQQESAIGSQQLVGQIVKTEGCWYIAGEGGMSGCVVGQ